MNIFAGAAALFVASNRHKFSPVENLMFVVIKFSLFFILLAWKNLWRDIFPQLIMLCSRACFRRLFQCDNMRLQTVSYCDCEQLKEQQRNVIGVQRNLSLHLRVGAPRSILLQLNISGKFSLIKRKSKRHFFLHFILSMTHKIHLNQVSFEYDKMKYCVKNSHKTCFATFLFNCTENGPAKQKSLDKRYF